MISCCYDLVKVFLLVFERMCAKLMSVIKMLEILDVINNRDQKSKVTEFTKCQKVEMKVKVESDNLKSKIRIDSTKA
ncbi:hypothetical protein MKW92_020188 [Papaver armeniacum]|nr:hypothetical protein MKW92_020188 [Papaver armeniacum]